MKLDNINNGFKLDVSRMGYKLININATVLKVRFLKVIGNILYTNGKKLNENIKKVFKCIQ